MRTLLSNTIKHIPAANALLLPIMLVAISMLWGMTIERHRAPLNETPKAPPAQNTTTTKIIFVAPQLEGPLVFDYGYGFGSYEYDLGEPGYDAADVAIDPHGV
jgi:hypothetical protein